MGTQEDSAKTDTKKGELFHIFTTDGQAPDATITVRWCVCPTLLARLRALGARNLSVLISACGEKTEVRQLLPLERMMTYITFHEPGTHRVQASLVWRAGGNSGAEIENLRRNLLHMESRFRYSLYQLFVNGALNLHSSFYREGVGFDEGHLLYSSFDVSVDPRFFAKRPAAWLWGWANLWHEFEPVDQCQFRRRLILAFTLKLFGFAFYFLAIMLTRIGILFLGILLGYFPDIFRKKNIRALAHPLTMSIKDIDADWTLPAVCWPFMPIIPIVLFAAAWVSDWMFFNNRFGLAEEALAGAGGSVVLFALTLIVREIVRLIGARKGGRSATVVLAAKTSTEKAAKLALKRRKELEGMYASYADAACAGGGPDGMKASLAGLPRHRRSVTLRLLDLKARVCRPFAAR